MEKYFYKASDVCDEQLKQWKWNCEFYDTLMIKAHEPNKWLNKKLHY